MRVLFCHNALPYVLLHQTTAECILLMHLVLLWLQIWLKFFLFLILKLRVFRARQSFVRLGQHLLHRLLGRMNLLFNLNGLNAIAA